MNCVSPNVVATPLIIQALGKSAEEIEKVYETYSRLKGHVLNVKDVADAVLFLACNEFVSGHDLLVDGSLVDSSL